MNETRDVSNEVSAFFYVNGRARNSLLRGGGHRLAGRKRKYRKIPCSILIDVN